MSINLDTFYCSTSKFSMVNKSKSTNSSSTVDNKVLLEVIKKLTETVVDKSRDKCWTSTLKLNGRGHVQIKHKGIKYLGHRIMACSNSNPPQFVPYDKKTKIDASHLCGNRSCINPEHLHFENCLVNQTRDCCRMFKDTEGYYCPHSPPCIGCKPIK